MWSLSTHPMGQGPLTFLTEEGLAGHPRPPCRCPRLLGSLLLSRISQARQTGPWPQTALAASEPVESLHPPKDPRGTSSPCWEGPWLAPASTPGSSIQPGQK